MFSYLLDTQMEMLPLQLEIHAWSYRQEAGQTCKCGVSNLEMMIKALRVCGEEKSLLFRLRVI